MNYNKQRLPERQETAAPVRGSFDIPFFALTLLLLTIGVIMVLSASFPRAYYQGKSPMYYFLRQGLFAAAGVCFMIVFSKINMAVYRRFSFWVLAVSVLLLMVVPIIGTLRRRRKALDQPWLYDLPAVGDREDRRGALFRQHDLQL